MFFIMAAVNVTLVCVLRESKKRELLLGSTDSTYSFKRESCTLKIILFFFGLNYLTGFLWDLYVGPALQEYFFAYWMGYDSCILIEVLPFIGLLLFHCKNFKQPKAAASAADPGRFNETDYIQTFDSSVNEHEEVVYLEPNSTLTGGSKSNTLTDVAESPLDKSSFQYSEVNDLC